MRCSLLLPSGVGHAAFLRFLLLALTLVLPACSTVATPKQPKVIGNSLGMKFVLPPAGEFLMGSDEAPEALAQDYPYYALPRLRDLSDEAPAHRVRISRAFSLGQHEVTVGQFRQFVQASDHIAESEADGTGGYGYNPDYDPAQTARGDAFEGRNLKYSWRNPGFVQGNDEPVLNVTWNVAVAMSHWLGQQEGKNHR